MRLNRFLASCGLGSRRSSEALITAGRVRVNGEPVTSPATFVTPGRDEVTVDGAPVSPPERHTYYLLHKPEGVVSTAHDPEGRPTVMSLVPPTPRVFPIGRLDQNTSGALLLTDDGELAHRILHPRHEIDKEYEVVAEGTVSEDAVEALRHGVRLPDEPRPTAPATVEILRRLPRRTQLRLVLHEGRKRQVRRMLEVVGHPVIQLRRVRIGPMTLKGLTAGECRELTEDELADLRRSIRSKKPRSRKKRSHGG
jgi:23S rRNA pseudouridine2605 synthase